MNQEERDIRLFEYWQGELLSPEEVREVESWLGEKGENRRYFEDLQREFLRGGVGKGTEVVAGATGGCY